MTGEPVRTDSRGGRWADLGRTELIELGRTIVTERLEELGCQVRRPAAVVRGPLAVTTPSGRALELFVSTQRLGGYVFWTKSRFELRSDRLAAIVLLDGAEDPMLYLIPSIEWRSPSPPLKDRPNAGKRSEPEYGVSIARSSLAQLDRYRWDRASGPRFLL